MVLVLPDISVEKNNEQLLDDITQNNKLQVL